MLTRQQAEAVSRFAEGLDHGDTILVSPPDGGRLGDVIVLTKTNTRLCIGQDGNEAEEPKTIRLHLRGPRGGKYYVDVTGTDEHLDKVARCWESGQQDGTKYIIEKRADPIYEVR